MDDIIKSGENSKVHAARVDQLLTRLKNAGLRLKEEKCQFAVNEAKFLGHKTDAAGVHTTDEKVQAILDATESAGKMELQAFLKLLTFYD